jgi:hypothetical protein
MLVRELIDILQDQPPDAEVELAVVAPVDDDADDITVDRYSIEGVLPWDDGAAAPLADGAATPAAIWLVGGEDDDVDAFLDAIEDDEHEHDHDHDHPHEH